MLVIRFYTGIVAKIALSMAGFQENNDTGVVVAKELSLKVSFNACNHNIIPTHE